LVNWREAIALGKGFAAREISSVPVQIVASICPVAASESAEDEGKEGNEEK
jgi:hypothetical protein